MEDINHLKELLKLKENMDLNYAIAGLNCSPLQMAVERGSYSIVHELMAAGANVMSGTAYKGRNSIAHSPLMLAVKQGDIYTCSVLLKYHLDMLANRKLYIRCCNFSTIVYSFDIAMWLKCPEHAPIYMAIKNEQANILDVFMEEYENKKRQFPWKSVLYLAIERAKRGEFRSATIQMILNRGYYLLRNGTGQFFQYKSLAHMAVRLGPTDLVQSLMEQNPLVMQEDWLASYRHLLRCSSLHIDDGIASSAFCLREPQDQPISLQYLCKLTILAQLDLISQIEELPLPPGLIALLKPQCYGRRTLPRT